MQQRLSVNVLNLKWNKIFLGAIFIVLFSTSSSGDDLLKHITIKEYPPGSYRIKYGGIRGFLKNQVITQMNSLHKDYLETYYPEDFIFHRKQIRLIRNLQYDLENNGAWYYRKWWNSLLPNKGGVHKGVIVFLDGPQKLLFDMGFAHITSDFRFKLKEYIIPISKLIQNTKKDTFHNWDLRIKPSVKLSSSSIIRIAKLSLFFEYSHLRKDLISVEIHSSYRHKYKEIQVGINIYFLQW